MALEAQKLGYQYLGITDHSQSAVYAGGLPISKVIEQHQEIDQLNEEFKQKSMPFKVFKGIESDILPDGNLDYPDAILKTFDFVVASVHSAMQMSISKATERLIKAIENPYTTILGHPTGRLLLRRGGYPLDMPKIIDACASNSVSIEINAHPVRLDLDWRWVHYALERGVKIAICPDAHTKEGYRYVYYGVLIGRKGGLSAEMCLNALNAEDIETFFKKSKQVLTPTLK
jgi:DNA polymerase (family X)